MSSVTVTSSSQKTVEIIRPSSRSSVYDGVPIADQVNNTYYNTYVNSGNLGVMGFNGLTGLVFISGSGLTQVIGNSNILYIYTPDYSGFLQSQINVINNNPSGFLNTLSGLSINYVTGISGALSNRLELTGQNLLSLISAASAGVISLNGLSGVINLNGAGNVSVSAVGQNIFISGNTGAYSNFATVSNLATTGSNLQTQLNTLLNQTGNYYLNSNPQNYATSGNLASTGSILDSKINSLSGYSNGNFATISNLQLTGSNLLSLIQSSGQAVDQKVNSLSGYVNNNFYLSSNPNGYINSLSGLSTGYVTGISGFLQNQINTLTSNLAITGSNLDGKINSLSGYSNSNFATIINLAGTGTNLQNQINTLINQTGNYYLSSNPQQYATSGNLQSTGITLNNKINSLSGYVNSSFSAVYVTGSNIILTPNFTGIGGTQVILSGNNTILISGGAGGGGGNTTNNYYINSGSGLFLFRSNLTNGNNKQFITYPISIDYVPLIIASVHNDSYNDIISCQISGSTSSGFWAVLSNTLSNTGYYLDILTCNSTGTGVGISNISVNNSINYTTGSLIYVTGLQRDIANFTGVGNTTVTSSGNIVYISGNTYFNTLNLDPVRDNNININLTSSPVYFHTGSSNVTWTLPAISGCTGRTYFLKNKGSAIILTKQPSDFIFSSTLITGLTINSGEAYMVVNDGLHWSIF